MIIIVKKHGQGNSSEVERERFYDVLLFVSSLFQLNDGQASHRWICETARSERVSTFTFQ